MAPEVLCGKTYKNEEGKTKLITGYDYIAESWSLGCVIYECCVLHSPFDIPGQTLRELCYRVKNIEYMSMENALNDSMYSPNLHKIVSKCLQKPNDRITMNEINTIANNMHHS